MHDRSKVSLGTAVFALVLLVLCLGNVQAPKSAVDYYRRGYAAANSKHWQAAADAFRLSYSALPHSATALWLALVNYKLKKRSEVSQYAEKALSDQPVLDERWKVTANALIKWAHREAENAEEVDLEFRADTGPQGLPDADALSPPPAADISGQWICDDGGTYSIRQVGVEVWWLGLSPVDGRDWTNVFHGTINEGILRGRWADLPRGRSRNAGELEIRIESNSILRKLGGSDGFGDWTRKTGRESLAEVKEK